jgi:PilZ domain
MKGRDLRAEARIQVKEKGSLNAASLGVEEDSWFPCMVQDMSDSGLLMLSGQELAVGQVLDFKCELFPEKTLKCKVEIKHVSATGAGAKIVEVDKRGAGLIELYLQEQYSLKMHR